LKEGNFSSFAQARPYNSAVKTKARLLLESAGRGAKLNASGPE